MTREEAIKNIKEHCYFANLIPQAKEALDMAIKALKQEPCDKCVYSTSEGCQYDDITETIPPFEPCEDAISRQAVLNVVEKAVTKEVARWSIKELPPVKPQEPFDDTILTLTETLTKRVVTQVTEDMDNFIFTTIKPWCEAKEQRIISKRDLEQALTQYFSKEPCEDAISRQAVINHICEGKDCYKENCKGVLFNRCPDITWVNELPPFNPQKPICPSAGVDCEDCPAYEDAISRKAVTDALCSDCELYKDGKRTCFMKCEEYHFLTTLPPVVTKEERALLQKWRYSRGVSIEEFEEAMYAMSSSKNLNKWIPLKTRPMTDEESTFYRDWAEYGAELFDCPLPDDGQEVLVSWGGNVCIDTFVRDDRDGCYFEGVDIGDVEAWQPLPKPYEPQERRKNDT